MPFGLGTTGFTRKRLADVRSDLEAGARAEFGSGVNTGSSGAIGKLLGLVASALAELWELGEAVWSSLSPSTAEGVLLDSIVELNNITRLAADETEFWARLDGTDSTTVGAASQMQHPETLDAYEATADVVIEAANAVIFDAAVSAAAAGAWAVTIDGTAYNYVAGGGDTAQAIVDALAAVINRTPADLPIASLSQVTRTFTLGAAAGDVTAEFPVGLGLRVFGSTGNDGLYTVRSRTFDGTATSIVVDEDIDSAVADGNVRKGLTAWTSVVAASPADAEEDDPAAANLRVKVYFPAGADDASAYAVAATLGAAPGAGAWAFGTVGSAGLFRAVETGPKQVNADQDFTILSGTSGWSTARAALAGDTGRDLETDAELRIRRLLSLQQGGSTVDAIRAAVLAVDAVDAVRVNENDTDAVVGGLAAHSVQVVVEGGLAAAIAAAIWAQKPAGIALNGARTQDITDTQGVIHTILFDRVTTVRMIVVVHSRTAYAEETVPAGAAALIADAIEAAGNALGIDQDVIAARFFGAVFGAVAGLQALDILVRRSTVTQHALDESVAAADQLFLEAGVGDVTATYPAGTRFTVEGNTGGLNGTYTVSAVAFVAGRTRITTEEDITITVGAGANGTVQVAQVVEAIADAERATFDDDDVQVTLPA